MQESAPKGQELDVAAAILASFGLEGDSDPMEILRKHGIDNPEILAAQLKNVKTFDKTYGLY